MGPRDPARAARKVLTDGPLRLLVHGLARPEVLRHRPAGRPPTARRAAAADLCAEPPQPPRHAAVDHLRSPSRGGSKLVVAAAADFFFDARWKGIIAALSLNAIPIDREVTGRKTSDQIRV